MYSVCRIWWLLKRSHLMVPLCLVVCPVGAHLTAVCGVALCPVVLLLAFLPVSGLQGYRTEHPKGPWAARVRGAVPGAMEEGGYDSK